MGTDAQIDRGTLVDAVYQNINSDIRKQYYAPGQKLVLRELSERYGISQTPIKQALNRLISEKVVENVPRYGVYVRRINWKAIEESLQARLMIEEFCIPFVLNRIHDIAFMEQMHSIINAHMKLKDFTDYEKIFSNHIDLDMRFHRVFIETCNNSSIIHYYNELTSPIFLNYVYFGKRLQRLWEGLEEHIAIFQAVKSGDAEDLRQAVYTHKENTKKDYKEILKDK